MLCPGIFFCFVWIRGAWEIFFLGNFKKCARWSGKSSRILRKSGCLKFEIRVQTSKLVVFSEKSVKIEIECSVELSEFRIRAKIWKVGKFYENRLSTSSNSRLNLEKFMAVLYVYFFYFFFLRFRNEQIGNVRLWIFKFRVTWN